MSTCHTDTTHPSISVPIDSSVCSLQWFITRCEQRINLDIREGEHMELHNWKQEWAFCEYVKAGRITGTVDWMLTSTVGGRGYVFRVRLLWIQTVHTPEYRPHFAIRQPLYLIFLTTIKTARICTCIRNKIKMKEILGRINRLLSAYYNSTISHEKPNDVKKIIQFEKFQCWY
jgi:hypothetical protein